MNGSISNEIKEHKNALIVIPSYVGNKKEKTSVFGDDVDIETTVNIKKKQSIPQSFDNLSTWIESTSIVCWYCTLPIEGVPVPMPISRSMGKYDTEGLFCTFNCVCAYVMEHNKSKAEINVIKTLMQELYQIFYNKTIEFITPSPSKTKLEKFGGHMSDAEYKKQMQCNN